MTWLWQVKGEMNIDRLALSQQPVRGAHLSPVFGEMWDTADLNLPCHSSGKLAGGILCSLGEPVTFSIFSRFCTRPDVLQSPPKRRHPERSASQIYPITEGFMARSRRACPERGRGNPGDACWQMLSGALRPQTTRKLKKSQPPTGTQRSGDPAPSEVEWGPGVLSNSQWMHMEAEAPPSVIPPAPA